MRKKKIFLIRLNRFCHAIKLAYLSSNAGNLDNKEVISFIPSTGKKSARVIEALGNL